MLYEYRLGHNSSYATRPRKPKKRRREMAQEHKQITHGQILTRPQMGEFMLNLEFASQARLAPAGNWRGWIDPAKA
jgi:hypothetical protein